jgi:ceramide glucosyltransferase
VEPEAYRNYAPYCSQDYPEYQIVFGVRDPQDPSIPIVRQLIADFPQVDISLIISSRTIGTNLKVSNLENMLTQVKYEHVVIVDSDIRVGTDYLRTIIPPLSGKGVGLVTCPYRSGQALNWPTLLESLWITTEFMPSVFVANRLEGMRYALGATMVTTRQRLCEIGGFPAMADHLADDYILGHLVWKRGEEVRLVNYVVETFQPPVSFLSMLKHRVRVSRGIRACRPWGHFGLVLTYGTALCLLNVIVSQASLVSLAFLSTGIALRLASVWLIGAHWLKDKILRRHFWLVPVSDLLTFIVWILSYAGRKVEWRGGLFELGEDGKLVHRRENP